MADRRDTIQSTGTYDTRTPSEPSPEQMLGAVFELSRELHLEMDERQLIGKFLDTLAPLFPERRLSVRVFDARSLESARCYVRRGTLRAGVETERITLKQSSMEKTQLKTALAASARVRTGAAWDAPFHDVAAGFAVPLAASGELYGVLDVGYPLGTNASERDEELLIPFVNHLSVALRNEKLHRETALLRDYQSKLIEHADALILGVDERWRITVCNRALCRLSGYDREELIGRDVRDWMAEPDRPRLMRALRQAFSSMGKAAETVDVDLVTRSGKAVKTVWSVARIAGRQHTQAVVAIGQDHSRLADLQNQVIQAEKLATLGQLAAGVVHELNNPLTSITVYAEYLLKKAEAQRDHPLADETDREKLRRIGDGANRILEFAKDLVQYARPAGDEPEYVHVAAVARQSLSFCEHLFERSDIELVSALDGEIPMIDAVPGQLEQVVINLVTNACHAVGHGGRVDVEAGRSDDGGVYLAVSDDGPGIPEHERQHIFEPFFSTKPDGEGTGLGLSIVRNIVEQHRGAVRIETAPEGGARFVVWLPASRG